MMRRTANIFLIPPKCGANDKTRWLFLFMVLLIALPLWPKPAQAQKEELRLTLRLRKDQYDYYNIEATAGRDNKFVLEVRNIGTEPVAHIRLTAEAPEGWIIGFRPAEIDYLGIRRLETVDVNIRPESKAIKGRYSVTFVAQANEVRKREPFSVTLNPGRFWLWVWIVGAVVVIAIFVFVYWRFGRQKSEA